MRGELILKFYIKLWNAFETQFLQQYYENSGYVLKAKHGSRIQPIVVSHCCYILEGKDISRARNKDKTRSCIFCLMWYSEKHSLTHEIRRRGVDIC